MRVRNLFIILLSAILLSGCCLKHNYTEATCEKPQTCTKCGEEQGITLEHNFTEATCNQPKTCVVCGKEEGTPLEHEWLDATYESPMICSLCGETQGEPLEPVEIVTEEESTETTEESVDNNAVLSEDDYKGDEIDIKSFDEATQNVIKKAKDYYEKGIITKEEYETIVKEATGLNDLIGDLQNSQPGHIDKDVGYGTPGDPSKDGTNPYKDVDLPAHLKGDVVQ